MIMRQTYIILMICLLFTWSQGYAKTGSISQGAVQSTAAIALFIENKGQVTDQHGNIRDDIQFKLPATKGLNLFIGNGEIHYQWYKTNKESNIYMGGKTHIIDNNEHTEYKLYRMDIELLGANKHAEVVTEEANDYYEMYYTATTGKNGSRANTFKKITYIDVYPNIDWVLYTHNGQLKHEFIVKEGGNATNIRIKYKGASELILNTDGSLTATTPMGTITEAAPISYTDEHINVASSYELKENIVSYNIGSYIGNLTIDPKIEWGTYYAGLSNDYIYTIVSDSAGNTYSGGRTTSTSNINSAGAHSMTYSGNNDGMIVKLRKDGSRDWGTYYGGTAFDNITDMAINGTSLYITGNTSSTSGIATTGSKIGGDDGFVAEFNNAGVRQWARYYGGTNDDYSESIAIGPTGNIHIGGYTFSTNGIVTNGVHQTVFGGGEDAFIMILSATGSKLVGTYLGGPGDDGINEIDINNNGNTVITGYTTSTSKIATSGSHQTSMGGGAGVDAFVSSFSSTGQLNWSSYYGGPSFDNGTTIITDNANNTYLLGETFSTQGIATTSAHQTTNGGDKDGFLVKFNNAGSVQWSTYYGGTGSDAGATLTILETGNLLIGGSTNSSTAIATTNTHLDTYTGGGTDGFFAEFTPSGSRIWGSYFGGGANDQITSITSDQTGGIYVAGNTSSNSGIATPGTIVSTYVSGSYGYITRFCHNPTISTQPSNIAGTSGGNIQFSVIATGGYLRYQWQYDNGTGFMNVTNSGQYSGATTNTLTVSNLTLTNNDLRYRCILSSSSCMDTTNEAKLTVTVGIDDINKKSVKVYPNPVKDYVTLTADVTIEEVTIYSITGRKLQTVYGNNQKIQLNMGNLNPGMYIIKINNTQVVRVTKQ